MNTRETDNRDWPEGLAGAALEGVLIALLALFLASTRLLQPDVWIDDAFIHFRNARNFAEGLGLVFNPGERLIGSTSPVFVLLLGLIGRGSGMEIPLVAQVLNLVFDGGSAGLCLLLLARTGLPRLFRYAIVFVVFSEPLGMLYSTAGMEMSLFILASLAIVASADRGWWWIAGLGLGVLGWIRPEGVTVGLALVLALALAREPAAALKTTGLTVLIALLAGGALFLYYGTVFPQSLVAKATATWFPVQEQSDAWLFFQYLARLGPLPAVVTGAIDSEEQSAQYLRAIFAAIQVGLMIVGGVWWFRRRPVAGAALPVFAALYFVFYAVTNPKLFEWYYVPLGFTASLLAGVGAWAIVERVIRFAVDHGETQARSAPVWAAVAAVGVAFVLMLAHSNVAARSSYFVSEGRFERHTFRMLPRSPLDRLNLYAEAARAMERWRGAVPEAVASTPEIGVFAWFYRGRVLDPYALVSPEALDVLDPAGQEQLGGEMKDYHPVNVYVLKQPEFVMTSELFLPRVPEALKAAYTEVRPENVPFLRFFVRSDVLPRVMEKAGGG